MSERLRCYLGPVHPGVLPSASGSEAGVRGAVATAVEHVLSPEAVEAAASALLAG